LIWRKILTLPSVKKKLINFLKTSSTLVTGHPVYTYNLCGVRYMLAFIHKTHIIQIVQLKFFFHNNYTPFAERMHSCAQTITCCYPTLARSRMYEVTTNHALSTNGVCTIHIMLPVLPYTIYFCFTLVVIKHVCV